MTPEYILYKAEEYPKIHIFYYLKSMEIMTYS